MIANAFASQYKNYSNNELLDIIHSKEDYQPAAIEAANAELASRGYNVDELEQINSEWLASHLQKLERGSNTLEKRIKTSTHEIVKKANPLNKTGLDKEIALIIFSSAFLLIYELIGSFHDLLLVIKYFSFHADSVLTLMPFLFIPIGLYYFNKRDRLGWVILNCWYVYTCVCILPLINYSLQGASFFIFKPLSITSVIITGCIYCSLLNATNRTIIRGEFKISSGFQSRTLILSAIITIMLLIYI
jgi:hypothetical protein